MKAGFSTLIALTMLASPALAVGEKPLVGGWSAGHADSAEIRDAARFAIPQLGHKARLARIESASQQVVAGMNYRLTLRLTNGQRWEVAVWRQLDGSMKLNGKKRL